MRAHLGDRDRRLPRRARTGAHSSPRPSASAARRISILSGKREAHLTALGVVSGIHKPDGIVGDLGGGSLELVDVHGTRVRGGVTLPLGGLALAGHRRQIAQESREDSSKRPSTDLDMLQDGEDRTFYAVGGTWRALARLHMWQTGYPFHVMHDYRISGARGAGILAPGASRRSRDAVEDRSRQRRAPAAARLCGAGAWKISSHAIKPKQVVISVLGVREGLLYSIAQRARTRARSADFAAAADLNVLRSRSPRHGEELIAWTDRFIASSGLEETADEERLRHAACLLGDIGWRAHPDYRGEQSMNIIANGAFVGDRPSWPRLSCAIGVLPPCRFERGGPVAATARARHDPHA